jgi:hypothetical protein
MSGRGYRGGAVARAVRLRRYCSRFGFLRKYGKAVTP